MAGGSARTTGGRSPARGRPLLGAPSTCAGPTRWRPTRWPGGRCPWAGGAGSCRGPTPAPIPRSSSRGGCWPRRSTAGSSSCSRPDQPTARCWARAVSPPPCRRSTSSPRRATGIWERPRWWSTTPCAGPPVAPTGPTAPSASRPAPTAGCAAGRRTGGCSSDPTDPVRRPRHPSSVLAGPHCVEGTIERRTTRRWSRARRRRRGAGHGLARRGARRRRPRRLLGLPRAGPLDRRGRDLPRPADRHPAHPGRLPPAGAPRRGGRRVRATSDDGFLHVYYRDTLDTGSSAPALGLSVARTGVWDLVAAVHDGRAPVSEAARRLVVSTPASAARPTTSCRGASRCRGGSTSSVTTRWDG